MFRKVLLFPYWLVLKTRQRLYDSGRWKVWTGEVPTICVGNLAAGGTGKTPHTQMILQTLLGSEDWKDKKIAVLSRGHKRNSVGFQQVTVDGSAKFYGDEPLQMKKRFPSVTVAVDRPRVEGCDFLCHPEKLLTSKKGRKCKEKDFPSSDIIVLDDAFQYRSLKAHVNIVLVEWKRPLDKDMLLPFGRLRDLPERISEADIVIATKCPSSLEEWEKNEWVKSLGIKDFDHATSCGEFSSGKKVSIFFTSINYETPEPIYKEGDTRYIYSKKLILFSGIAKDTPLRMYLSDKYKIVSRFKFSDHHKYNRFDLAHIMAAVKLQPTALVATTEKDSQRILDYKKVPLDLRQRLFQIPISVAFLSPEEKERFRSVLTSSLRTFRPDPSRVWHVTD